VSRAEHMVSPGKKPPSRCSSHLCHCKTPGLKESGLSRSGTSKRKHNRFALPGRCREKSSGERSAKGRATPSFAGARAQNSQVCGRAVDRPRSNPLKHEQAAEQPSDALTQALGQRLKNACLNFIHCFASSP